MVSHGSEEECSREHALMTVVLRIRHWFGLMSGGPRTGEEVRLPSWLWIPLVGVPFRRFGRDMWTILAKLKRSSRYAASNEEVYVEGGCRKGEQPVGT